MEAQVLIDAIAARGSDATDVRDAAHEAHHALSTGMAGRWTRTRIDRAVKKMGRLWAIADEALARAVEQIVCKEVGVETDSIEKWIFMSCMETMKYDRFNVRPSDLHLIASKHIESGRAQAAAERVLALARSKAA